MTSQDLVPLLRFRRSIVPAAAVAPQRTQLTARISLLTFDTISVFGKTIVLKFRYSVSLDDRENYDPTFAA